MLATTKSGNLKIREDGKGLLVEAKLPRNPLGEYARSMIESGDVRGMSYGIQTEPGKNRVRREGDKYHRRVTDINRLIDTTLTWEPAYEATTVELRAESFTAAPLQELIDDGLEEQTDEAATEVPPVQVSPYQGRMAEVLIDQLEKGGVLL
jgi:phage head maturation protease